MQTIGERLEEARKRKGISIREAAEHTKIRGDYLQKFEANSFDIDLPALYIRGFVRTYARYLELDPERLVSEVDATLVRDGKPARREQREPLGRVDFGAGEARSQESGETATSSQAARDKAMLLKFGLLGGGAIVVIVVVILLINVLFSSTPAKPVAAAEPPAPTVQADPAQTLTLTAVEATRVKVVQDFDGATLYNGALVKGETKSFKKQGKLLITVEAGKNLRMEVNGRSYPVPLDGYGRFALD
ncbi:cytoskeletal protein RodZ [Lacunisphaera limnophila]|uniref:Cytoskeletal protein RodZ n=1 Tax=Lacunisphaera limnophila TaxID=1838286 RepID=A0A1D8AW16_9BACT|nr:helix-turn-helix domain-containing protein [Lacunisphaera limnophila]AOS45056.1 cytoskeletal protein RodZ [Lacunisphaera limnophila]